MGGNLSRIKAISNPTIVDVAHMAGVSLGTASRVLNNRRGVDPELVRKVNDAARSLSYVRSATARRASRDTAPVITFVLSNRDFLHPVHARLLQGPRSSAKKMATSSFSRNSTILPTPHLQT